jgi:hypothetical protein
LYWSSGMLSLPRRFISFAQCDLHTCVSCRVVSCAVCVVCAVCAVCVVCKCRRRGALRRVCDGAFT